jgi:hypothetical protein
MFPIQNLKGKASGKNRALRCTCNCAAVNAQRQALSLRLRMGSMGLVIPHIIWLVVWNMNFILPKSWDDDRIWLSYFSGGLKPPVSNHHLIPHIESPLNVRT